MRTLLGPVILALVLSASSVHADEEITLTTPIQPPVSKLTLQRVHLDLSARTVAVEIGMGGTIMTFTYDSTTTPTGATLLNQLNRGNFSVNSLARAIFTRITTDNPRLAGSLAGTPF